MRGHQGRKGGQNRNGIWQPRRGWFGLRLGCGGRQRFELCEKGIEIVESVVVVVVKRGVLACRRGLRDGGQFRHDPILYG